MIVFSLAGRWGIAVWTLVYTHPWIVGLIAAVVVVLVLILDLRDAAPRRTALAQMSDDELMTARGLAAERGDQDERDRYDMELEARQRGDQEGTA